MATFTLRQCVAAPAAAKFSRRCVRVRASAATEEKPAVTSTPADWRKLSVTKMKLTESLSGTLQKNIDGQLLTISYDAANDNVIVEDKRLALRYPTTVGKDQIIRFDLANATRTGIPTVPQSEVSKVLGNPFGTVGPELINGRAAMVGLVGVILSEIGSGETVGQQMGHFGGFFGFAFLSAFATAASLGPLLSGAVTPEKLFPSENDSFPDQRLPTVWTATAEKLNGRVAMMGFLLVLVEEHFSKHAAF